ncbi:tRNA-binding protein [Candidatus Bathyarchaeota archaeon]|jgi:methionine--tRNA ligase beta chain|nr:MAG: tRNA-binding protein [Candidatus Bathyarchaeota archaeon]
MKTVSYEDFEKLEIRIVEILKSEAIPGKTKILKLIIDIGSGESKTIVAGGGEFYTPESFLNKKFVAIINLAPKMIAGVMSQGMLLAADVNGKPSWLIVKDAPVGAKII